MPVGLQMNLFYRLLSCSPIVRLHHVLSSDYCDLNKSVKMFEKQPCWDI